MRKLILGCGYLGERVAHCWRDQGDEVTVVTRSAERASTFRAQGFSSIIADVTQPTTIPTNLSYETILYAIGFDRQANKPMRDVYVGGLQTVLDRTNPPPKRFLYISSTGVYGETDGPMIDESTRCQPTREGGKICLEAEETLRHHAWHERSVILRLAGIYGPGRIPRLSELRAGRPLDAVPHGLLNLIHVDDAAQVVLAAERRAATPALYIVSDGAPVVRENYYQYLAELVNAPPPRFAGHADTPRVQRAETSKRLSNEKMLRELDVQLKFPSYREGLASIVTAERVE